MRGSSNQLKVNCISATGTWRERLFGQQRHFVREAMPSMMGDVDPAEGNEFTGTKLLRARLGSLTTRLHDEELATTQKTPIPRDST
jgi:hypothetical protein